MLYVHNELVYDANITHNLNTMADEYSVSYDSFYLPNGWI